VLNQREGQDDRGVLNEARGDRPRNQVPRKRDGYQKTRSDGNKVRRVPKKERSEEKEKGSLSIVETPWREKGELTTERVRELRRGRGGREEEERVRGRIVGVAPLSHTLHSQKNGLQGSEEEESALGGGSGGKGCSTPQRRNGLPLKSTT